MSDENQLNLNSFLNNVVFGESKKTKQQKIKEHEVKNRVDERRMNRNLQQIEKDMESKGNSFTKLDKEIKTGLYADGRKIPPAQKQTLIQRRLMLAKDIARLKGELAQTFRQLQSNKMLGSQMKYAKEHNKIRDHVSVLRDVTGAKNVDKVKEENEKLTRDIQDINYVMELSHAQREQIDSAMEELIEADMESSGMNADINTGEEDPEIASVMSDFGYQMDFPSVPVQAFPDSIIGNTIPL